jgi:hypothetical protein
MSVESDGIPGSIGALEHAESDETATNDKRHVMRVFMARGPSRPPFPKGAHDRA